MFNVPTSLNNLKTKVNNLNVGKLKTISIGLKNVSDLLDNEVVKNIKFNTLKSKVNEIDKKIPDATTFVKINQYNADKQNFEEKKSEMLVKR